MTGRRAIFCLCIFCAIAFSAVGAQGAAAAGQRFYTCVSTAPVLEFKTEHCVPGETSEHNFGHKVFNEITHLKLHNAKTNPTTTGPTNAIFKETIAATNLELESTGTMEGLGTVSNEEVGGEWRGSMETNANGVTFTGVEVKAPAGKGCKVFEDSGGVKGTEGVVKTRPVKGHTTVVKDKEEGVESERHSVIIEGEPRAGKPPLFATFFIECEPGKVPAELEGTWEITGTITCPTRGATIDCSHNTSTSANTLKGKGAKAGLFAIGTDTAGPFPESEPTHPISETTVP